MHFLLPNSSSTSDFLVKHTEDLAALRLAGANADADPMKRSARVFENFMLYLI